MNQAQDIYIALRQALTLMGNNHPLAADLFTVINRQRLAIGLGMVQAIYQLEPLS
jgi:hypothetical protein